MRIFVRSTAIALLVASGLALAQTGEPYDEMYDDDGSVRPIYAEIHRVYSKLTRKKKEKLMKDSVKDFEGDNALLPLPRLLGKEEFETLRKGIEQRARAITLFLQDHYSGKRRYKKAGIFPAGVLE